MRKAVRGRIRGEFYIRKEIKTDFEKVANNLGAKFSVNPLQDAEMQDIQDLFGTIAPLISKDIGREGINPDQDAKVSELQQKLEDREYTIQNLETEIKALQDLLQELQNQLSQKRVPNPRIDSGSSKEWQEVLAGFQCYRDIFQTGMDNPKTQDGLYAALDEVAKQHGISEKEVRGQMDAALAIAKKFAGAG